MAWLPYFLFFIIFFFFQFISTLVLVCVERKSLVNASLRGQKGPFNCWLCSVTIITKNLRNLDIGVGRENKKKNKKRAIGIIKIKYHFLGLWLHCVPWLVVTMEYPRVPTDTFIFEKKKNKKKTITFTLLLWFLFFFDFLEISLL